MIYLQIHTPELLSQIAEQLKRLGLNYKIVLEDTNIVNYIEESSIVILEFYSNAAFKEVRDVKTALPDLAIEYLICIHNIDVIEQFNLLNCGGFDVIKLPFDMLELELRIRAAEFRILELQQLLEERQFYKLAVQQEESLASRVLDHNITLKQVLNQVRGEVSNLNEDRKKLIHQATIDELSGLHNRSSLFDIIAMEINRARRNLHPLAAIMIDIDEFKSINDMYGHAQGDEVIRGMGACLSRLLRDYDIGGRYGGEEFVVILPNTSLEDAYKIAERFRTEFASMRFGGSLEIQVSASLGVAPWADEISPEDFIARADMAMYYAKEQGRNRSEIFKRLPGQ